MASDATRFIISPMSPGLKEEKRRTAMPSARSRHENGNQSRLLHPDADDYFGVQDDRTAEARPRIALSCNCMETSEHLTI
jgi:hypothetical protein